MRIYAASKHLVVPCYVATHSLINYAQWKIVSPESSLLDVGADGYIAQVWTGTARTPNVYNGVTKQRTFDKDPYNQATDWWNSNGNHFATPRDHLFKCSDYRPPQPAFTPSARDTSSMNRKVLQL